MTRSNDTDATDRPRDADAPPPTDRTPVSSRRRGTDSASDVALYYEISGLRRGSTSAPPDDPSEK